MCELERKTWTGWHLGQLAFQCFNTTNDFHDFTRDLTLTGAIVSHGQLFDHVPCTFRCTFHRNHSSDLLADRRIQKALEKLCLETGRHDLFQDAFSGRLKLVLCI